MLLVYQKLVHGTASVDCVLETKTAGILCHTQNILYSSDDRTFTTAITGRALSR